MNIQKFFEVCKAHGIEQAQIQIGKSKSTSIKLFHNKIDTYRISNSQSVTACGIYNGKFGSASTQKLDKDAFEYLAKQIQLTATFNEKEEEASLFKGSEKYRKGNVYNKVLPTIPLEKKIETLHEIEKAIYAGDPCITDADAVSYGEAEAESEFYNSFGLKLKQKSNHFFYSAGAVAKKGEETKTFYDSFLDNDYSHFDAEKFAKGIVTKALAKFGGEPCEAGKYPTILDRDIISDLISYFMDSFSSESIQKHSSMLEGKMGQKVASSKVTIEEKPLARNLYFSYFDDEGVATQNKVMMKRGVVTNFFYNRETAKKEGKASTGNGYWAGGRIGVGFNNIFVKPGKHSFDEMIQPIHDGVYITEIAGLGTGMNPTSGDFSGQAEGYRIRDGKIAEPLNLITLSGNLLKMLHDVKEFDSRVDLTQNGISVSDVFVKSMSIGGK